MGIADRGKATTAGMRWMLYTASALVFLMGISLFALADHTQVYAPWTIQPPLTAAFLGAGYWAACVLEFMSARQANWARARVAVPAVWTFTFLTMVVTLMHIGRFHFGATRLDTVIGTWAWMVVYTLVPIALGALWIRQVRMPGAEPPRLVPLQPWLRAVFAAHAVVMLALGIALLLAPLQAGAVWPWKLSPLTGRAVGVWLIGMGVLHVSAARANDWTRIGPVMVNALLYGLLLLFALIRYPATPDWSRASAWIYVAFVAGLLALGLYGTVAGSARRRGLQGVPA